MTARTTISVLTSFGSFSSLHWHICISGLVALLEQLDCFVLDPYSVFFNFEMEADMNICVFQLL